MLVPKVSAAFDAGAKLFLLARLQPGEADLGRDVQKQPVCGAEEIQSPGGY